MVPLVICQRLGKNTYGPDKICMRKREKIIMNKEDRMDVAQTVPLMLLLFFQQNEYTIMSSNDLF